MKEMHTAIKMREDGRLKESNLLLLDLVNAHPDDAMLNYQCGWSFDVLGLEAAAIPYYEKAITLGLPENDLRSAYLGLGSTYRCIGEYQKAAKVFTTALARFPEDNALKTFYAMVLYNLGAYSDAMQLVLQNLADTSADENIAQYKKAIRLYSEDLNKVW